MVNEDPWTTSFSERTICVAEKVCDLSDDELEELNEILRVVADMRYRPEKELLLHS